MKNINGYLQLLALAILLIIQSACKNNSLTEFNTNSFLLGLNDQGSITQFLDNNTNQDYIAKGQSAPFLSIRIDEKILAPSSMILDSESNELVFNYDSVKVEARVKVEDKNSHLTFELIDIHPAEKVELIIWGPYPTTINKSIGETVGVVRGEGFAMGIQALNPKTLGGYPWKKNDCMPQLDIFEGDDFSDLSEEGKRYVLYRVEAAKPEDFGSTLQAYCRNRSEDRIIENWQHPNYLAPAYVDGGVVGSRIALFGCPVEETLDYIGKIEIAENLPHPIIAGEWGKKASTANSSYMIMNFGEEDVDMAIGYAKQAGLNYLYHSGPFKTWGNFELGDQFPNGLDGLKNCVEMAEQEGIHMGVHTLSNFITTNDAYVNPVPDERLAKVGSSKVSTDIDEKQSEIEINSPEVFQQLKNNNLKTVVINKELIRYGAVSESEPWKLMDCQRGAFETIPSEHKHGDQIALLADHGYKVFLSDAELTKEIAINLANLFNEAGLRQISFDGLEGNRSTGMGNYGEILMTSTWYDNLDDNIKSHLITDASRTSHYFWHIYSRMNWGEPWYAGFRESQAEYRFKNQKYFERNLMPGMLGWFLMTEQTTLEDIEWMLAKAAGYNAGFGFVSSYKAFENNGMADEILEQISLWEDARLKGIFDEVTRENLKDPNKDFRLEKTEDGGLKLTEIQSFKGEHTKKERQPGEPLFTTIDFDTEKEQNLSFIITAFEGGLKDIQLELDNYRQINFPGTFEGGDIIKYDGGNTATVYYKNWQKKRDQAIEPIALKPGEHSITMDCQFQNGKAKLKLELRVINDVKTIQNR